MSSLFASSCGLAIGSFLVWRARRSNRPLPPPAPSGITVGVLHPGHMGASVIFNLVQCGHTVLWNAEGRSNASAQRARANGATDAGSLAALVARSDVIISVCPPDSALAVALAVASISPVAKSGEAPQAPLAGKTYVDANAIAPATAERIARVVADAGGTFVDGGIVGGPAFPREPATGGSVPAPSTRLYLSAAGAADAERVAALLPEARSWLGVRASHSRPAQIPAHPLAH